jgi:hypothetical protein
MLFVELGNFDVPAFSHIIKVDAKVLTITDP